MDLISVIVPIYNAERYLSRHGQIWKLYWQMTVPWIRRLIFAFLMHGEIPVCIRSG